MEKREDSDQVEQSEHMDEWRRPPGSLRRQFIGALIGAAVALLFAFIGRQLGWWAGSSVQFLLWGGVIGGLIGGSDALAQAGRRLTGREEDWINILVSLVSMAVILGLFFLMVEVLTNLLRGVFG